LNHAHGSKCGICVPERRVAPPPAGTVHNKNIEERP
jgi:hypothetical protein